MPFRLALAGWSPPGPEGVGLLVARIGGLLDFIQQQKQHQKCFHGVCSLLPGRPARLHRFRLPGRL